MLNDRPNFDSSVIDAPLLDGAISLTDILQRRAVCHPHRTAYTFLDFGGPTPRSLTYGELNQEARQLAFQLHRMELRGERAVLLYPPGLDYIVAFYACLYSGTIAVPAYPPSNNRHMPRLQAIIDDSKAKIILTTGQVANSIRQFAGATENLLDRRWVQTDTLETHDTGLWQAPVLQEKELAFLQYTSGSTGNAKGVMISHGNLMANQQLIQRRFGHDERSTVVGWLPLYHDMGLIGNVMQPLYCGASAVLMSPMAFLEKPLRWLQAISDYRAHTSGGPNFAYDLCARKISRDELEAIDLSSWQLAFNGAEPVNPKTLERFSRTFADCGFQSRAFYPCYGLAEATLLATGGTKQSPLKVAAFDRASLEDRTARLVADNNPNARQLVGCGAVDSHAGQDLRIVDPENHEIRADNRIGEIWLSGPSIAQGYWQNPENSHKTFVNDADGQCWLRTGDLGFINDGELFVSGRLKDLIIVRGRNYYPHDLEYAVESATDALNPASTVAFAIEEGDGEKLIVLAELKRNRVRQGNYQHEFAAIRARLTEECGIQAERIVLLKPGAILKTSSGKLRRNACRDLYVQQGFTCIAVDALQTANDTTPPPVNVDKGTYERRLLRQALLSMNRTHAIDLLAGHLAIKAAELSGAAEDTIEPNHTLTGLGLDSLKAVEMKYFIDELLAVDMPITGLLGNATLIDSALTALNLAKTVDRETPTLINNDGRNSNIAMSYNQQALWTRAKIESAEATLYHMPIALQIRGKLDNAALDSALAELHRRHSQLGRGFDLGADNRPVSLPLERLVPSPKRADCSDEIQRREALRIFVDKPFDLQRGPLLRCGIFSCSDDDHILAFCAHHLIVDFRSLQILLTELQTLYAGYLNGMPAKLPPPKADYGEFVAWQRDYLSSEAAERDSRYWQEQLAGELPRLELPGYFVTEAVQASSAGMERLSIATDTLIRLKNLASEQHATLYTLLLTVFKTLLYRYNSQNDLIVGTPTLGRPLSRFADLVGYFVNPVALRSKPSGGLRFREYLSAVNTVVLGALEHQHYPQTRIIENLRIEQGQGSLELYRTFFALQDGSDPMAAALAIGNAGISLQWAGFEAETCKLPNTAEEFALAMLAAETAEGISVTFRYRCDALQRMTVVRLLGHFQCLLHGVLADPDCLLSELPLLTVPERRQQMEWNTTTFSHPDIPTLHRLFEAQSEKTPDAIALTIEERSLTYAELNAKANQLAHYLIERGVGPDVLVGICLERSLSMVIGLLGILKAGGAYVPLDPNYPAERRALILADADVKLLLTREALDAELAENADSMTARGRVVYLDCDGPAIAAYPETNPTVSMHPLHPAYLIYTSGSTGRPKGVVVCHSNAVHSTWARFQAYPDPVEAYLLLSSFAFDSSVAGIFWTLGQGGRLCLPDDDAGKDPAELAALIQRQRVSHLLALPSLYRLLLGQPSAQLSGLKAAIVAGEACATDVVQRHFEVLPAVKLYNEYGPTEGTVWSSVYQAGLNDLDTPLSIGRPIANVRLYILDRHLNPLPVGVAGELYIGGAGVVPGYLRRPALTAERFIPDPFQVDGGRLYKTGDLARYRPDGAIEFLGRLDYQVKIRGFRIELGEIEAQLLQQPNIKDAVVIAREDQPGDKRLVAYLVEHLPGDLQLDALKTQLKNTLPDYMIPGAFVVLDDMPLGANGKLDRKRLPAPDWGEQHSNHYVAPHNEAEQTLVEIWQQLLAIDRIGRHDSFFELGGDSILSIQVVSRARQAGIVINPKQLFERPTIAELALVAETVSRAVAEQGPVTGYVALTPIQHWFFEQGLNNPHHWNQALMLNVKPELTPAVFAAAVRKLLFQHDALRMRFGEDDGLWRQTNLEEETETVFEYIDLSAVIGEQQLERLRTEATARQAALNLSQGPLLRAAWFDLGNGDNRVLIAIHHLVVDGVSWRILLEDLETLCRQNPAGQHLQLPAKTTSFQYWSERLSQLTRNGALNVNPDYWLAAQRSQAVTLPVDYPQGANQVGLEDEITVTLNAEQTQSLLQEVPAAYRTQIDDLLLTALALTLRDWLKSDALANPAATETLLLIDRESHGREHLADDLDIARTVGWFSNVYPLQLALPEDDDLAQALKAVKEQIRAVPEHGIGYGLLRYLSVDARIRQALADQPPARIIFNYLGQLDTVPSQDPLFSPSTETTGLSRDPTGKRSHELEVVGSILNSCLQLSWRYSRERYRRDTLETLANCYLKHLQALIGHCSQTDTGGYTPSDFPLAALSPAQLDALNLPARQIDDLYPLAPLQHGLIFHSLYEPNANVYRIQLACRLTGRLDAAVFQQAWRQLLERHAILRTRFLTYGLEQPLQLVDKRARLPIIEHDWRNLPDAERQARWQQLQKTDHAQGFEFDKAPLMRLHLAHADDDLHYLLWSYHHVLLDGWSMPLLIQEVFSTYHALQRNERPNLPTVNPYRDYIAWLQRQDMTAAECYWRQALVGFEATTILGADRAPGDKSTVGASQKHSLQLTKEETLGLQQFAKRRQLTLNTLAQAAWGLLLSHYSGNTDVVFGITVSGRPAELPGIENQIGLFINTLPMRVQLNPQTYIGDWLQNLFEQNRELRRYEYAQLAQIQAWSDIGRGQTLFDSLLVFENYPIDQALLDIGGPLKIDEVIAIDPTNYPLTLTVFPGERLQLEISHDSHRFTPDTVVEMLTHLRQLLTRFSEQPQTKLGNLPTLTADRRQQILADWNATEVEYPQDRCIHQLFEAQVEKTPDAIALTFEDHSLSYAELNAKANQLAHYLIERGIGPDVLVGICLERSLEMVIGLLGILKAGGAYVPLDPGYPKERLAFLLNDVVPPVILSHASYSNRNFNTAQILNLDSDWMKVENYPTLNPCPVLQLSNLAYCIYTSGSTGQPKGAGVPHQGILNRLQWMQTEYSLDASDTVLQKTPYSFDVSVWEFFWPLLAGARLVVAAPELHKDSHGLIELIRRERITTLHFVPSMLQTFVETSDVEQCLSLKRVICSGEALPADLVQRFQQKLPAELYNLYGPTEASVDVSYWGCPADCHEYIIPIGQPIANIRLYILDRNLNPVPVGTPGELHIAGIGLGRGYLNRPGLTAEKFIPDPFGPSGSRLYKTGDLTRYRPDGNIDYLGRIDHQVKIRGFRIELGEIEAQLLKQAEINDAVVVAREDQPGDKRLVAYLVPHAEANTEAVRANVDRLKAQLIQHLPDYMVPSTYVVLEAMPLSANGKLDRKLLPAPDLSEQLKKAYIAPRTETERVLAEIWQEVLGVEQVGIEDDFFELGGHSLLATQLMSRITKRFSIELPLRHLFEHDQIAALAEMIARQQADGNALHAVTILPYPRDALIPLSYAQQRLWFLDQLEPDNPFYNIPVALRLIGYLDIAALAQSFAAIVRRHEVLRTVFDTGPDGEAVQIILPDLIAELEPIDLTGVGAGQEDAWQALCGQEAAEPFDLRNGPLIRARLLRLKDNAEQQDALLLLTMHHIVSDGWSAELLVKEFSALYRAFTQGLAAPLAELPIQYADFACWQRQWLNGEVLERQLHYWRQQLDGSPLVLDLPTDRPRPAVMTYRGATLSFELPLETAQAVRALSRQHNVTLFMALLAVFQLLLSRYSGQADLCVGSPVANRNRPEIESVIGFFVNTLVLRADLSTNPTVAELLAQIKTTVLDAQQHQDLPFEKLVEALQPERDPSRSPLFQVMFVLAKQEPLTLRLPDLSVELIEDSGKIAKFDLTLHIQDWPDGRISGSWEYNTDLYDVSSIERLERHYQQLLQAIVSQPQCRVSELPLLSEAETRQILIDWNATEVAYPQGRCIHQLFEAQAEKTPGAIALCFEDQHITYAELNAQANQLAHYLIERGVSPDVLVGICLERSLEMVVGLLGILKAGGAYVPLDPHYPAERRVLIFADAGIELLLTCEALNAELAENAAYPTDLLTRDCIIHLDCDGPAMAGYPATNPSVSVHPLHLAYLIYTSGSTGRPKGVAVNHRNAVHSTWARLSEYPEQVQAYLLLSSFAFDSSVAGIFWTLAQGGCLCLPHEDSSKDPVSLAALIERHDISHLLALPSLYAVLLEQTPQALSRLQVAIVAGEACPTDVVKRHLAVLPDAKLYNEYGPTEGTVWSSIYLAGPDDQDRPLAIGRPLANGRRYNHDRQQKPAPRRVAGDL